MMRHVIVGTGVAGMSAAESLRDADPAAEILLIGDDPHGFYSKPGLAYYLTGEIPEEQLYVFSAEDWCRLNLRFLKARATRLQPKEHRLELDSSEEIIYDRLLLATGATAIPMKEPGSALSGVVKLDTFEDAREILALARKAKSAVVVGGGIIAMELVEGLLAQGIRVHYFLRGDRYWSNILDEEESRMIEQHLVHGGVHIHYQTEIAEIMGRRNRVAGVRTTRGETFRCEIVAVGIGVRPRMELAQSAGLGIERGIVVNEYLQTSAEDVFAAGDVAQVMDPRTLRSTIDNLWNPGREQGHAAAINMTGRKQPYNRTVAVNVLRLAGVMTTIIGAVGSGKDDDLVSNARGSSETWLRLPNTIALETNTSVNHLHMVIGDRDILGCIVMGDQTVALPLKDLISAQVDISSIRAELLQKGASLSNLIMGAWSKWRNHATQ